jgi:thymidylate synthase
MPAGPLGWEKATRVYTDPRDRPTKPSYFSRLIAYPDRPKRHPARGATIDQIETIVEQLDQKPGYSCLSFVFLRPADLLDKVRPGYVPCPIAGDFKLRGGKLSLSVMFRTMDVLSVGYADIFYLRNLQRLVLTRAQEPGRNPKVSDAQVGDLNLFLSRAFITKRLGRGKDKRVSGVDTCRRLVEELRRHEG